MNKVFLVINYTNREMRVFERAPHIRRYELENAGDELETRELEWHYKTQLVEIMNKLLFTGQHLGEWLEESDDDEPDDDPMWADADALASAGHGMDEDYM
jgi:hypothetical protein